MSQTSKSTVYAFNRRRVVRLLLATDALPPRHVAVDLLQSETVESEDTDVDPNPFVTIQGEKTDQNRPEKTLRMVRHVQLKAGSSYRFELTTDNKSFDPYLILWSPSEGYLEYSDDLKEGDPNSRIVRTPRADATYRIVAVPSTDPLPGRDDRFATVKLTITKVK